MVSEPFAVQLPIRFGDGFELDPAAYELRRTGTVLKLERIPLKILFLLLERPGQLISREQIVERIWGSDIHVDTDNSINGAIRKIRQALGDSCEQPRFIQTVTGEGYRFMAAVRNPADPLPVSPAELVASPVSPALETNRKFSFRLAIPLVLILVLIAVAIFLVARRNSPAGIPAIASRSMLAVLPFENLTGDPSQEYFSDGMTEEMIAELGRLDPHDLGVIARTSVMHYKNSGEPLDQIGRELGVQYVLEGSVRRDSEHIRITAELIQVRDQTHLWAKEFDREPKAVLTVQNEIARAVSAEIQRALDVHLKIDAGEPRVANATSYEAFDLYLKGRFFWNKRTLDNFEQAASYFQQAISKDPGYAPAYAGLADTYGLMSTWYMVDQKHFMPRARAAALKALELDESLAEAHTSLALVAEDYDYDWKTAEKEFRRAIQLNPDYATAHQWYAEFLSLQGRFDEALTESERARQLDPLSLIIAGDHGAILYYSRQYDRAIQHCKAVLDMDPQNTRSQTYLFFSYVQEGNFQEALDTRRRYPFAPDSPWTAAGTSVLYGKWGRDAQVRIALNEEKKFKGSTRPDVLPALVVAYSGAGAKDQVLALLEEAYSEHSNAVVGVKVDPVYDFLRSDPRFQNLLDRLAFD